MRVFCFAVGLSILFLGISTSVSAQEDPVVVVHTSLGQFEVQLYQSKSPITVKNFLDYVAEKHYDGTLFHRVKKDLMIQGGGFTKEGQPKPTKAPIKNESGNGVKNVKYTIAMARASALDSATCQFFINVVDNDFLDQEHYCAFGKVISGMEVVDKIRDVPVGQGSLTGRENTTPVEAVLIRSIRVKGKE